MAPLDLDKYVEIARLCKYLPENDLKVSPAGAGALLAGLAPSGSGAPAGPPFSPWDPRQHPVPSRYEGGPDAVPSDSVRLGCSRRAEGAVVPRTLSRFCSGDPEGCRGLCPRVVPPGLRVPQGSEP